jgi:predicted MFS family arabinose efflux permease
MPLRRIAAAYRAAFSGLPREVWLLALGCLVNRAGTMVLPFLSLYLTVRLRFTVAEAGLVLGLWGVGSMLGSYLGGRLADRFGPLAVQVGSLLAVGGGFLVLSRLEGLAAVAAAVLVVSTVGDAFRPALLVAASTFSPVAVRTRALALVRLANNLGMAIGPALGGVLAVKHYAWLFAGDAATCWAAALVLWLTLHRVGPAGAAASGGRDAAAISPWRDRPYLAFLVLVVGWGIVFMQIWSTLPLYWRLHYGLGEDAIGLLLALNPAVIVLFEMVLLHAVEHLNPLRVVALGTVLIGAGFAATPFGRGIAWAVATVGVWTLGEMLSLPLTNAVAGHRAPAGLSGAYMGAYTLAFSAALVFGPTTGTAVFQAFGGDALWLGAGVLAALLAVAFRLLAPHLDREAPPSAERGSPGA